MTNPFACGKLESVDSDVDLLAIMPARNQLDQAVKIRWELPVPFALDLLVCKPEEWQRRIDVGESFCMEILATGKVLYVKDDEAVGEKALRSHALK